MSTRRQLILALQVLASPDFFSGNDIKTTIKPGSKSSKEKEDRFYTHCTCHGSTDAEQRLAEEKEAQQRLRRAFLAKRKQERLKKKRKALKSNTHTKPFSKPSDSAVSEAFKKPPFHNCEYKEGFKICS